MHPGQDWPLGPCMHAPMDGDREEPSLASKGRCTRALAFIYNLHLMGSFVFFIAAGTEGKVRKPGGSSSIYAFSDACNCAWTFFADGCWPLNLACFNAGVPAMLLATVMRSRRARMSQAEAMLEGVPSGNWSCRVVWGAAVSNRVRIGWVLQQSAMNEYSSVEIDGANQIIFSVLFWDQVKSC